LQINLEIFFQINLEKKFGIFFSKLIWK
jgi:hypothetical protein